MTYSVACTQDGVMQYPMHTHKDYEIMMYLEGTGYMRTERGDIPFCPGTIVIVPPYMQHGSTSEKGFKNISVQGDFTQFFHFDCVKSFLDNELQEGRNLANAIYYNRFGKGGYLSSLCTAYAYFLLQRIEVDSILQDKIQQMVSQIAQNAFDSDIDLTAILLSSGYSEDYIRYCFKQSTGKTPNQFLTDVRIKHACFLIDIYQDTIPLSEIAEKCGYGDYIYFSKKFKERMGGSPRSYRNG